jgi:hypothetical protein
MIVTRSSAVIHDHLWDVCCWNTRLCQYSTHVCRYQVKQVGLVQHSFISCCGCVHVSDPVCRNLGKGSQAALDSVRGKDTEVALCDFVVIPIGPMSYAERQTDCLTSSEIKNWLLLAVNAVEFEHSTLAAATPTKINWDKFLGIIWPFVLN